jgi:hypothetical protein
LGSMASVGSRVGGFGAGNNWLLISLSFFVTLHEDCDGNGKFATRRLGSVAHLLRAKNAPPANFSYRRTMDVKRARLVAKKVLPLL